jgi:hypothetical protein
VASFEQFFVMIGEELAGQIAFVCSDMWQPYNNKAKLTMRKSYGFRTFHVTETALYHALGKLPEPDVAHRFF